MNQILVTLENGADTSFIQKVIENMKGVLKTSLQNSKTVSKEKKDDGWLDNLRAIKREVDPSLIDMNDERTRYLMSK